MCEKHMVFIVVRERARVQSTQFSGRAKKALGVGTDAYVKVTMGATRKKITKTINYIFTSYYNLFFLKGINHTDSKSS